MDEPRRDSFFRASFRSFGKMFFGIFGLFLALVFGFAAFSFLAPSPLLQPKTIPSILPNAQGVRSIESPMAPVILQIPIHGVIGMGEMTADMIQNVLLDSRDHLFQGDRVKGILLHFNTPGGTVVDSEAIYQMLLEYKERYQVPIFGYVEGLCASGGMYIASSTDQMFAGPASVIGSVGVILGPFFNASEFIQHLGVQARTLTEGIDKDMMSPWRPYKEGEDASLKAVVSFMYQRFVDVVTKGRPRLNRDLLITQYGAQVYDPVTAEKLGYIDHAMTTRNEALSALLQAAHVNAEAPYQVITLAPRKAWLNDVVQGKSPLMTGKLELTVEGMSPLRDQLCYLYTPTRE